MKTFKILSGGAALTVLLQMLPAHAEPATAVQATITPVATTSTSTTSTSTTKTEIKTDVKTEAKSTPAPLPAISATPGSPEEIAQLRALVEALTSRLQTLETDQKKTDATVATVSKNAPNVSSNSKLPVTISGLFQVRVDQFNNQNGIAPNSFDTLRLRRAELRLTAPQITSRISGTVMFDLAKTLSTSTTGSGGINQSSRVFQELQLSYLLHKGSVAASGAPKAAGAGNIAAAPNNIYIDAGQFKLPIGYEGDLVSSSAIPTVERALMFVARDPFGGGFGDIRDTGVQIRGTQGQFRYWAGIFNGLGERQNDNATSDTKALIARLAFNPKRIQGLTVGISGARGDNRNTGGVVLGDAQRANRSVLNAFANYQRNKLTLRAEYLTGKAERSPSNTDNFNNHERGYYALVAYQFTPKIEGVLRYDVFDFDTSLSDAQVRDIVAGINYYLKGNNAKIQLNVVRRSGGSDIVAGNGFSGGLSGQFANTSTQVRLQAQVGF